MKKFICSMLLLVILLTSLSVAAFATDYFETYNVPNTFFDSSYSTLVPDVNTVGDWGATGYYRPGLGDAYVDSTARFTYMYEAGEEWADIYVYICGDGWITNEDETLGTYELRDAEGFGDSSGDDFTTGVYCTSSLKALKTYHFVKIEDVSGRFDRYEATYVCPRYYALVN